MSNREVNMFKYAEKCLYEYKRNIACLEILREDLRTEKNATDVQAQTYDTPSNFTGDPSNPVQSRIIRIERLEERIKQLERYTQPVTQLISDLNASYVREGSPKAELYALMELYYFGQNSTAIILAELHISRQSLFNRRRELVKMLMGYMGCV